MRVTRVTNVGKARKVAARAHIRLLGGERGGREVVIPPVGIVVGADSSVGLCLDDPAVSGRHCSIVPTEGGFVVEDLESRNGTFVDGVSIGKADVPVGAVLRVGRSLLQLMPAEESMEIPPSSASSFGSMLGTSVAMRQVYALLERASPGDAPILILGESGTGKELTARAIHEASRRADGPFVVFDCGAASESLIESALFGYLRGAFTGAERDQKGAFAAAHGGTLFLDEIGDLPLNLQPKLLRMLEAGEVTPLGTHKSSSYDVRIVAATNRDLFDDVSEGRFRGDLYYRLAVVEAHLPPLRQRLEDLPILAAAFLRKAGALEPVLVEGPKLDRLRSYHWPGNIRELRNVMTRAVALSAPGASFADMPIMLRQDRGASAERRALDAYTSCEQGYHEAKAALLEAFERGYLEDLLAKHGGNLSQAARVAGVERKYLYQLLERHGLRNK